MSNLIDIQNQIEKLQKQASEIKAREFDKTVKEILTKMNAFGITVKDLQSGNGRSTKSRSAMGGIPNSTGSKTSKTSKTSKKGAVVVAPKYMGPNGETWSGRGLMPRWLAALVGEGKKKEEFAIKG